MKGKRQFIVFGLMLLILGAYEAFKLYSVPTASPAERVKAYYADHRLALQQLSLSEEASDPAIQAPLAGDGFVRCEATAEEIRIWFDFSTANRSGGALCLVYFPADADPAYQVALTMMKPGDTLRVTGIDGGKGVVEYTCLGDHWYIVDVDLPA